MATEGFLLLARIRAVACYGFSAFSRYQQTYQQQCNVTPIGILRASTSAHQRIGGAVAAQHMSISKHWLFIRRQFLSSESLSWRIQLVAHLQYRINNIATGSLAPPIVQLLIAALAASNPRTLFPSASGVFAGEALSSLLSSSNAVVQGSPVIRMALVLSAELNQNDISLLAAPSNPEGMRYLAATVS